jgi:hypothetical protein
MMPIRLTPVHQRKDPVYIKGYLCLIRVLVVLDLRAELLLALSSLVSLR